MKSPTMACAVQKRVDQGGGVDDLADG